MGVKWPGGMTRELKAVPVVLDFESLRHEDANITRHGPVVSEYGFTITAFHPSAVPELNTAGTLHQVFPGSTALFHGISLGEVVLTPTVGGIFDSLLYNLLSIDLVELPGLIKSEFGERSLDLRTFDISFFGTRQDGTTLMNTFTITNFFTIETFIFSGFTDIISVSWFQGGGGPENRAHQFGDIMVEPIHEPSAVALRAPVWQYLNSFVDTKKS